MTDPCEVAWRRRPGLARSAAAPRQSPRQVRPRYHASPCGECGGARPDRQCSFAIFVFYAPLAKQNRCQYNGANTSPTRWGGTTTHLLLDRPAQANRAQSNSNEPAGPGLMSFQKVTLPSAPNLYSSVPSFPAMVPWRHAAFWKMDAGVESRSSRPGTARGRVLALTSRGLKPPGTFVHWVTLPSAPNLNSCPPTCGLTVEPQCIG